MAEQAETRERHHALFQEAPEGIGGLGVELRAIGPQDRANVHLYIMFDNMINIIINIININIIVIIVIHRCYHYYCYYYYYYQYSHYYYHDYS